MALWLCGNADKYFDLDLGVFWNTPPTDDERQAVVDALNADLMRLYPYDEHEQVWSDDYMLGRNAANQPKSGIMVEVSNYTSQFAQQSMRQSKIIFNFCFTFATCC